MTRTASLVRPLLGLSRWERLALTVWVVLLVGAGVRVLLLPHRTGVYPVFAQAGRDWAAGRDPYGFDCLPPGAVCPPPPTSVRDLLHPPRAPVGWGLAQFRYSPLIAGSFAPLGPLPAIAGELLWRVGNALALVAAAVWWLRRGAPSPLTRTQQALFVTGLAFFSTGSIGNGQVNPLLLALVLAGFTAVAERRFNLASVCLALAFWLKLYPLVFVLLLGVLYPRRLAWRLPLAIAALGAAAFLLQRPGYVAAEYVSFARALSLDNRSDWPTITAYRDLRLLLRVGGLSLDDRAYTAVRTASAALVAGLCLVRRKRDARWRLTSALNLGLCWILLCGPATEGATYQLLGPPLLWTLFDAWRRARRTALVGAAASALAYLVGLCGNITPAAAEVQAWGPHPLSALILFGVLVGLEVRELLQPSPAPPERSPLARAM
jgi:hypothetical protein